VLERVLVRPIQAPSTRPTSPSSWRLGAAVYTLIDIDTIAREVIRAQQSTLRRRLRRRATRASARRPRVKPQTTTYLRPDGWVTWDAYRKTTCIGSVVARRGMGTHRARRDRHHRRGDRSDGTLIAVSETTTLHRQRAQRHYVIRARQRRRLSQYLRATRAVQWCSSKGGTFGCSISPARMCAEQ
jgi:hypothetical protein